MKRLNVIKPLFRNFSKHDSLLWKRGVQTSSQCRSLVGSTDPVSGPQGKIPATMIPGDGVGPELMNSVKDVFSAAHVPVEFEEVFLSEIQSRGDTVEEAIESCTKNKVALKGILTTPLNYTGSLLQTVNSQLRVELDLFANVVLIKSMDGCETRHSNLDFVVIREQTEGEYSALEHESVPGVVESLKIITEEKSMRIAKFAFDFATRHKRKKVTAVHKANIMKLADGLFLKCCTEVASLYPEIEFDNMIIDNCCMQLVSNPHQFDVMVLPNLYGNIVDNLAAGLVGGAGVVPGESFSHEVAVFEPGARHSYTAEAGKDSANPTAMLLAAANMLEHMNLERHSTLVKNSVLKTVKLGKVKTRDLGGYSSLSAFTKEVINNLDM